MRTRTYNLQSAIPIISIIALVFLSITSDLGRFLVSGVAVLLAPGYLLWHALGRNLRLPRLAVPALWLALSLSLVPIIFLWSSTLGLQLTPALLQALLLIIGIIALWLVVREPWPTRSVRSWLWAGYVLIFGLVALTRVLQIRGIALPLWVDSVHHTLLVRVIGETGRIPLSLRPYLPIDELPYHWGYHTIVAAWRGVSEAALAPSILWSGQVLNALVMPVMYAFSAYVLRSPRGGLIAAGCAGLLSIMPAYYVTWGRYTQLTGLLVLPVLLIASMSLLERRTICWRTLVLTAALQAGLFLIHYRVLIFYAAFMLSFVVLLLARQPYKLGTITVRCLLLGGLMLMLALPWVAILARRTLVPLATQPSGLIGTDSYNSVDWRLLFAGNNPTLFVVAAVGALLGIVQRNWRLVILTGWIAIMFLIANPGIVGLPPLWLINNHAVVITLFLPVSVLVAYTVNTILRWVERRAAGNNQHRTQTEKHDLRTTVRHSHWIRQYVAMFCYGLLIAVAFWGTWNLRSVINPQTILATAADLQAIEWTAKHTPADARFLINSTPWLNNAPRGTDAGWWLLPLAGRWVSTPLAIYIYGSPEYTQAIEELNKRIAALQPDQHTELHRLIRDARIDYVFVGSRGGPITHDMVRNDPLLVPVYDHDNVLVAQVQSVP